MFRPRLTKVTGRTVRICQTVWRQLQATLQASRAHLIAAARSPDAVLAAGARTSLQIAS